ncbi:hypothetical protein [Dyadobacter psychrotolerans]|uniref:Uncharacterized protein n=1 Tax=Dyadobacter psychrotolerans TaxID=2541721 RepID=A0A4R5DZN5_9BACT|nr:hypothetical protein [Dyadobacter psychrotolerans]TDE18040.1 hypothetical protein E0F88_00345 [Dyadobacter psychrotolerans]
MFTIRSFNENVMIPHDEKNSTGYGFLFSNQKFYRLARHLIFWLMFLALNVSVQSPFDYQFKGSPLLFYSMCIPAYYLGCYLIKILGENYFMGLVHLIVAALILLITSHFFLLLIFKLQNHFAFFSQYASANPVMKELYQGAPLMGPTTVLSYLIYDLYFLKAQLPAFAVKLAKWVYKTTQGKGPNN